MTENKEKLAMLYHGSLEELNSRMPKDIRYRYAFAEDVGTVAYLVFGYGRKGLTLALDEVERRVLEDGFAGLVNRRTSHSFSEGPHGLSLLVEGTPIVRVTGREETQ